MGFDRNQELGINLRSIVAGSTGKFLIQAPKMRFDINAGLAASTEDLTDDTTRQSIEGLIRSSFDLYQFNVPITRLSATVSMYPGITESGRFRVNTQVTLRHEILRDFFWDLTFYSNFDNQPAEGAEREDYGIITSLGATF